MHAMMLLADGTVFHGEAIGAAGEVYGEVVCHTSMTAYPEVLTDAACKDDIVVFTYPLIGNIGVPAEDGEYSRPQVKGVVAGEICTKPSNWRTVDRLEDYLLTHGVPAVTGIDTRALSRHLRRNGTMRGAIVCGDTPPEAVLARLREEADDPARDLIASVTPAAPYVYHKGSGRRGHVVVVDCGATRRVLSVLSAGDYRVTVVPAYTAAEELLAFSPDGVIITDGPGDPKAAAPLVETTRRLLGQRPLFGFGLGQLIIALALGADTYKLKYGHRGANHPVEDLAAGRVFITSQNHGFAVKEGTLPAGITVSHVNLNDGTIEGFFHEQCPVFAVQFFPEAAMDQGAGPAWRGDLFNRFLAATGERKQKRELGGSGIVATFLPS
ncbi:MAG TPA: glutamine-hydrolyzing carbamoyl-phosphate synthase small subunit [Firmicutes bacterium]|nr:glutamine-hydrolyzing carbamoyl-phosphate synthase small subunit [Bacillota bacterium]